jgi:uncharacterized protein YdaU (DUF1376 family)
MSRKSPAFSFYPDSWVGGTRRMSLIEKAIYIELLSDQWLNGPFSLEMACRICAEASPDKVEEVIRCKFSETEDGFFFNERLEHERAKQEERYRAQRENGRKGGRPRSENNPIKTQTKPMGLPNDNPIETQTLTQTEPKQNPSVSVSDSVINTSLSIASPTVQEVAEECKAKGYREIDPVAWWGYWDSVGWRTKNQVPIRWKSRLMADNQTPSPNWKPRGPTRASPSTGNRRNQGAVYDPTLTKEKMLEGFK